MSASALHPLLGVLLEGCRGAVRLAFERRSTASATLGWLEPIVDFDLVGIEGGSTCLMFEALPLRTLLPELSAPALGVDTTAFDLFLAGLRDAASARTDSERYDAPLLEVYGKLGPLLARGFDELEVEGEPPLRLDATVLQSIARLRVRVPPPRQVRVSGRLEPVAHDEHAFLVRLADGVVYGVFANQEAQQQLARSYGTPVVASGLAVFRPSGAVLRLEATHIEAADERATMWGTMPRPLLEAAEPTVRYRVRQGPSSGLAAIMGKWPGDETDEEIADILERLS